MDESTGGAVGATGGGGTWRGEGGTGGEVRAPGGGDGGGRGGGEGTMDEITGGAVGETGGGGTWGEDGVKEEEGGGTWGGVSGMGEEDGAFGGGDTWVGGSLLRSPPIVGAGSNNRVLRFGRKGSQPGQFDSPIDVAVRGDRLYVADFGNCRVQVFDLSGSAPKFCSSFPTTASPGGLAVQTDGTIVVRSGKEVEKFSPSGELINKFSLGKYCTNPYGLAVQRDGRVVVTDFHKHSIFLFEADGTRVKSVRRNGKGKEKVQFNKPYFICVDKEDNIIVANKGSHRVQVFDKNLNFQHKFGQKGIEPQDMFAPHGVSADSRGNIVLANVGDKTGEAGVEHGKKLQVFRSDGTWVSTISNDRDKLNLPHGVAVTEDGHVFVADTGDHCIKKYRYM
ncbi:E3 ubiquitin-protein ligase TRIM71-like [Branchiostoma floridae]|uniref:E3 ubiquitin-protein ligase TRIM71-like n=2 Tax=Branchiostoma floridae TaxID=7739 RepID=A0A9J7HR11_BRAFL|nr:E3 ubiquitin-protein ligase TRIM71-like [Branchiostoma floridae]